MIHRSLFKSMQIQSSSLSRSLFLLSSPLRVSSTVVSPLQLVPTYSFQTIRSFARYAPDPSQSLRALYPEIAAQWHPIKNGNLLPIHVHPHSNKVVWWKCPNGLDHEWCSPVRMRLSPTKKPVSIRFLHSNSDSV